MVSERERAHDMSYPDPIHTTLSDTHTSYNTATALLLDAVASTPPSHRPVRFVLASHNKHSILLTAELMRQKGIEPGTGEVAFAQLMGMQDGTTTALAQNGFKAYKVK